MKNFNILDHHLNLYKNYLIEASAGTGKTFAIENIVVRLILEDHPEIKEPLSLTQILIVTFTRAAAADLKMRIRSNLDKALHALREGSLVCHEHDNLPDYLLTIISKGEQFKAKSLLEKALSQFDQAQIFTIHAFCARMLHMQVLEGDLPLDTFEEAENQLHEAKLLQVIKDFFRLGMQPETFSSEQLQIIFKKYKNCLENLEKDLLCYLKKGMPITKGDSFSSLFEKFILAMQQLQKEEALSSEKILHDFEKCLSSYKKQGDDKEVSDKINFFAKLFDQKEWEPSDFDRLIGDGLLLVEIFNPHNLKVNHKLPHPQHLKCPGLLQSLKEKLDPIVSKARNDTYIFARMAYECQQFVFQLIENKEQSNFDDILQRMVEALNIPHFVQSIRNLFKVAIIDEFQDTDPFQWKIFNKLFLGPESKNLLYLVGDPKQSIYAFRQADIYTYLEAAKAIGKENIVSLDTNYRSQPSLVNALNLLFKSCPEILSLPTSGEFLEYPEVKFSPLINEKSFSDSWGSVHFFITEDREVNAHKFPISSFEENAFFPFIAEEIERLHNNDGIDFNQFTVLVRDRYQAQRIAKYLVDCKLPTLLQRNLNLDESLALPALKELLSAIIHPKQESFLKIALSGPIFGWTEQHIRALDSYEKLEKIVEQFCRFRETLYNYGYASFYFDLLRFSGFGKEQTIIENILSRRGGGEFYQDLQQLSSLLIEHQNNTSISPEGLIKYLSNFKNSQLILENPVQRDRDPFADSIKIMTMHASKGLEFDIVFALGLVNRTSNRELLIPDCNGVNRVLMPVNDASSNEPYPQFFQETDAEKIRQFYVTVTRAKYRLYLPVVLLPNVEAIEEGCASPMELFLARLDQPPISLSKLYERIGGYDGTILFDFLTKHSSEAKVTFCFLKNKDFKPSTILSKKEHSMQLPPEVLVKKNPQEITSYTKLAQKYALNHSYIDSPREYCEESFLDPFSINKTKNIHTLPKGEKLGTFLHSLLEKIPFGIAKGQSHPQCLFEYMTPYLKRTEWSGWESVIGEMLYNTFKATLRSNLHEFCLEDLTPQECYRETDFLYSEGEDSPLKELENSSDLVNGKIDLLFRYENQYYLLDWKSHWLGESEESYQTEKLMQVMQANHYFLQASLYSRALEKYLKLMEQRPFEEIFGGVFYLFLRGLRAHQTQGVLFFKPSLANMKKL